MTSTMVRVFHSGGNHCPPMHPAEERSSVSLVSGGDPATERESRRNAHTLPGASTDGSTAHRRPANKVLTSAAALTAALLLIVAGTPQAGAAPRRTLADTAPRWVAKTRSLGRANGAKQQTVKVYLAPKGGLPALKAHVAAVADPKSSSYRKFLTPAQYHSSYDATDAAVSEVSAWLRSSGLTVTGVEQNHRYITARGTVADLQKTFGVTLNSYRHDGQSVTAPTAAATVPANVASYVSTVAGLDTTQRKMTHDAAPSPGFRNARPCSISYGQIKASTKADFKTPLPKFQGQTLPYAVCGYTGPQLRAAYENNSSLDGSGITVAITDAYASPTIAKDANTYAKRHGDGAYSSGQLTQVQPGSFNRQGKCDPQGWYGEETLDVEAVHAMARGAKIRYYASASCFDDDFLDTLSRVVEDNEASAGQQLLGRPREHRVRDERGRLRAGVPAGRDAGHRVHVLLRRQRRRAGQQRHQAGRLPCLRPVRHRGRRHVRRHRRRRQVQLPDRLGHPEVQPERRWQQLDLGRLRSTEPVAELRAVQPAGYQSGVVPGKLGAGRAVPDVGLDADPTTGMLIGQTQTFSDGVYYDEYRLGGTSLASPLYAGQTALASQHAGGRLGFLNPTIYSAKPNVRVHRRQGARRPTWATSAPTSPTRRTRGRRALQRAAVQQGLLARVAPGWDNVTGVGSPNARWLTSISGT